MRTTTIRALAASALALAATLASPLAQAALPQSIAYTAIEESHHEAWLVTWQAGHRATLAMLQGTGTGTWTQAADGTRTFKLDAPIIYGCLQYQALTFHLTSGTQRKGQGDVVRSGVNTCPQPVPFTDPAIPLRQVDMSARPSVADLVPGAQIAGFTETPYQDQPSNLGVFYLDQDVVTFDAAGLVFAATGHQLPTTLHDGWFRVLVTTSPWTEQAYTRLAVLANGEEIWLGQSILNSVPTVVWQSVMTKPLAGAGFGTDAQAAHHWESGVWLHSQTQNYFYDLYPGGSGQRRIHDVVAGTDATGPATWHLEGATMMVDFPSGNTNGHRSWMPLANHGKAHFVLERGTVTGPGATLVDIHTRVNYFQDEGAAQPSAPR